MSLINSVPATKMIIRARQGNQERVIYEKDTEIVLQLEVEDHLFAPVQWTIDDLPIVNRAALDVHASPALSICFGERCSNSRSHHIEFKETPDNRRRSFKIVATSGVGAGRPLVATTTLHIAANRLIGTDFPSDLGEPTRFSVATANGFLATLLEPASLERIVWSPLSQQQTRMAERIWGVELNSSSRKDQRIRVGTFPNAPTAGMIQTAWDSTNQVLYGIFLRSPKNGQESLFDFDVETLKSVLKMQLVQAGQLSDYLKVRKGLWGILENRSPRLRRIIGEVEGYATQLLDENTSFRFALMANLPGRFSEAYAATISYKRELTNADPFVVELETYLNAATSRLFQIFPNLGS